ncbi:hypothetical protein [Yoonia sp. GPGPB17]|uniref:hypothetical protein n=1 Tax=Yoonia sp. GPGPB17 TaxID=3026147 RepID=UPI00404097BD
MADAFEAQLNRWLERYVQDPPRSVLRATKLNNATAAEAELATGWLQSNQDAEVAATATNFYGAVDTIANFVQGPIFGWAKENNEDVDVVLERVDIGELFHLRSTNVLSSKLAKDVFEIMLKTGRDPAEIVETEGMKQVTDTGAIEAAVDDIIAANPAQVEKAQANPKLVGWFVGQVMKATGGKANPAAVNQIVSAKLGL